jgi:hypothetical protein
MGLKGTIKKIEKYLHKELKYLMRETKVLQELKEDIERLESLLKLAKKQKDVAVLKEHYKKEAGQEEKLSERIERRLNIWLKRIIKLINNEEELSPEKENLEKFKSQIEIIKNNLVRILAWQGELHDLIENGEDWKGIKTKINEALGTFRSPGISSLIALLKQLESLEKRLRLAESRRGFLKKGAIAIAGGALALTFSPKVLAKIHDLLEQHDYKELRKVFRENSILWKNQVKPKVNVYFPELIKELISEKDPEIKKFIEDSLIWPINDILKKKRFTDEKSTVTPLTFIKSSVTKGTGILKNVERGMGCTFFNSTTIEQTKTSVAALYGLILTAHHNLIAGTKGKGFELYLNGKKHVMLEIDIIITCKEMDFAVFFLRFFLEYVKQPTGLRFTTSLREGEKVYIKRPAGSKNIKHGHTSKGVVFLTSYFSNTLLKRKHVDVALADFKGYSGDSGSPVFNSKDEVVGILVGVMDYPEQRNLCSYFIRTEQIFYVLSIAKEYFSKEIAKLK